MQRTKVLGFGACALSLGGLVSGSGCSSPDVAQAAQALAHGGFAAELRGCSEYVGLRGTPVARVRALVPARYSIIGEGAGQATVIVRAFQCANVSVDEGPGEPGAVAHMGVLIDSPDGDGVLNFATLSYATDLPRIHASLNVAGARAQLVEHLEYVFSDPEGSGSGTVVLGASSRDLDFDFYFEYRGLFDEPYLSVTASP